MTETPSGGAQVPPHHPHPGAAPRPPLRRAREGRYVAGVAEGIARALGVDPVLVRVAFAVATLFGGLGLVVYLVAWVLVPEDGADEPLVRTWGSSRPGGRSPAAAFVAVAAVLFVVWLLLEFLGFGRVLVNDYGLYFLPELASVFWFVVVVVSLSFAGWIVWRLVRGPAGPPPAAPGLGTRPDDWSAGATTSYAPAAPPSYQSVGTATAPPPRPLRPRPPRSPLGWLAVGVALLAAGIAVALNETASAGISTVRVLALALLVLGVGLVASAWIGRARWLLLPAAAVGIALVGPVGIQQAHSGHRVLQPMQWTDLSGSVQLTTGTTTLDLSRLQSPEQPLGEWWVDLHQTAGRVVVLVPEGLPVEVQADVGLGRTVMPEPSVSVGDWRSWRPNGPLDYSYDDEGAPLGSWLNVHVRVTAGEVEVRRVAS